MACQILFYFICFFSPAVEHLHLRKNLSFRFAKQQAPINMQRRLDVTHSIIQGIEFEISLVIRQKGEFQNGYYKKTKHTKFSEKKPFITPWYALPTMWAILTILLINLEIWATSKKSSANVHVSVQHGSWCSSVFLKQKCGSYLHSALKRIVCKQNLILNS